MQSGTTPIRRPPRWRRALRFGAAASGAVTLLGLIAWLVPALGGAHGLFTILYLLGAWPGVLLALRSVVATPEWVAFALVFVAQAGWYSALAAAVFWVRERRDESGYAPPAA